MFLSGCSSVPSSDVLAADKIEREKEIRILQKAFENRLQDMQKEIDKAHKVEVEALKAQLQASANSFYALSIVFQTIVEPTRTDLVSHNFAEEGWASLDHLLPDYPTMMKINQRIAEELDVTKTTLADLKRNHDVEMAKNKKLADDSKAATDKIAQLERERNEAKEANQKALNDIQNKLNEANDKIIKAEKEKADGREARQAQLAKLSQCSGVFAVLCLLGSLFSPVFRTELGIAATALAGAAVAIPFVEAWMVLAGFGIAAALIIIWALYRFHKVDKTNTALINRDHDIAQTHPQVFNDVIAPATAVYATKYKKDKGGNIITVPDAAIVQQIDSKLIATDRK